MANELITLKDYQTFETVKDMDATIYEYNKELNASLYETLRLLSQYSCKVVGVSHIKVKTIADRLDVSIATVKRRIKALKELGMITVINTFRRVKGGKGANAYVINTAEMRKKLLIELSKLNHRKDDKNEAQRLSIQAMDYVLTRKETLYLKSIIKTFISNGRRTNTHTRKINARLKRIENIKNVRQCPTNVPIDFYKTYASFFTDDEIATMYKAVMNRLNKHTYLTHEDIDEITRNTFDALVRKLRNHYKHGADPINNVFAFVSKVAERQAMQVTSKRMFSFVF
ncbi:helix-turn-helix domain-containing protein (plasmid) [Macrococcoides bohemicum]|uniref:Helix-turn-helix domain-containing protein n=1 Tax=Macrococcoides bohemicum TaxID=1903056 RepID=A0AAJ4TXR9_9STAP|nr:HTH domain-containing protein [Macrococcus bohemicus]QYA43649.1 helix-turn-helix domain-containing protein [Macrococcus bohemicus]